MTSHSLPRRASSRDSGRLSYVTLLLLVIATVSWRRGVYFDGGIDPVVVAKAMLSVLALTMAWFARQRCSDPRPLGGRTFWLLVSYLVVSTFGGYAAGQLLPSAVLSVRLLILALTILLLARTFAPERLVRDLLAAMLTVGLVAALTGLPAYPAQGRLYGGLPPVHANEIALLLGVPLLGLCWLALQDLLRPRHLVLALVVVVCIWLSGSRTGLAAVLLALTLMLLQVRRMPRPVAVTVAMSVPAAFYLVFVSPHLIGFVQRGGADSLTTFSSRTIAWSAAWDFPENSWVRWLGSGLSQKLVPVKEQWWDTQLLDSTWVSALVQAGLLGVLIAGVWLVTVIVATMRCEPNSRMLYSAVLLFLLVTSIFESGLLDSRPTFLLLMLVSLSTDAWTRRGSVGTATSLADAGRAPLPLVRFAP